MVETDLTLQREERDGLCSPSYTPRSPGASPRRALLSARCAARLTGGAPGSLHVAE
ncbi:hypothetical protein P7K49_030073 [Saguinus oedipus]|uniref:Uncharacterized protein n=1 Tax=Saguinus oedipus TaxID=9490 RepID=A0ABQ9U1Y0_SAGOE|nr:hypothetical protein P7K49_030073 [Saguinus oedipus]